MSRALRIQYPDAWYHVMNRGRRGEEIYLEKDDYVAFIDLLQESAEMFGDTLDTIAKTFNVRAYSSVSSVVNRTQVLLSKNRKLRKSCEQINFYLIKGQAKT